MAYNSPIFEDWQDVGSITMTNSQNGRLGVIITGPFAEWFLSQDVQQNLLPGISWEKGSDDSLIITVPAGVYFDQNSPWTWQNLLQ